MRALLSLLLSVMTVTPVAAQSHEVFGGLFPEAAVTRRLENGRQLTVKVEHQEITFNNAEDDDEGPFTWYRTDLMAFYGAKLGDSSSVALGLMRRFQSGNDSDRFIQQWAYVGRWGNARVAHRLRTDQTFSSGDDVEFRLRYRIAAEFPLSGTRLEPGENYLVVSTEPIFSVKSAESELENRAVLTLGRLLNPAQKVEVSLDYRTDGYIQEGFRTRLWLKVGFFHSF
jgi:hypothetical protein